jgi:hypothetical protein
MHESELLFQISQIVSTTDSFNRAVDNIRSLLEQALGARTLTVVGASDVTASASREEARFLSWKASPLRAGGRELGKLFVSSDVPHRVSNYTGEQLGMLLERIQLANQRTRLEAALSSLRADLATRKLVQRAQGILVARQHVTPVGGQALALATGAPGPALCASICRAGGRTPIHSIAASAHRVNALAQLFLDRHGRWRRWW